MYSSYIIYVQECDMEHTEDVQTVKFYTSFNDNGTIYCCECIISFIIIHHTALNTCVLGKYLLG